MPIDPEHLADDDDGFITEDVYCLQCGYLLKMLPQHGRCPECGNLYRAGGSKPTGVLEPSNVDFPAFQLGSAVASGLLCAWLVNGVVRTPDLWGALFAALFAFLTVTFGIQAWQGLGVFRQARRIAGREE